MGPSTDAAGERSPLLRNVPSAKALEPESLGPPDTNDRPSSSRVTAFDLTRGLICLLMAIDHTFFISGKEHPTESWSVHPDRHRPYLDSWYHYLLRFVTHTCAPGFCILMGLGIVYFVESRAGKAAWSSAKVARYIVLRGLMFILVGYLSLIPFRAKFHFKGFLIIDIIITLGTDFIIAGLLVLAVRHIETPRISHIVTGALGVLSIALACLTMVLAKYKDSDWIQILWLSSNNPDAWYISRFPPLSWLPLVIYGVFYGRLTMRFPRRTASLSFVLSIIFFLMFLAVRIPGGWGNLSPVKSSWFRRGAKEFFWTNKYCPDLAFMALFGGIDHLFITIFALLPGDFPGLTIPKTAFKVNTNQVLLDIGCSPFAYYFIHMYSLMFMGIILNALGLTWAPERLGPGYTTPGLGNGFWYWSAYGLLICWMWFVCRSYGRFKNSKPVESIWRYF